MSLQNAKLPQWIKIFKDIVKEEPAAVMCLNNEELYHYVNDKVPITNKLSWDYIRKCLNEDYSDNADCSIDMKLTAEDLRKAWRTAKTSSQVELFKSMMKNDKTWQRELSVLERRFKENWRKEQGIDLKADANVKQNVSITFKQV